MNAADPTRDGGQTEVSLQRNQPEEQQALLSTTPPGDLDGLDAKTSRKREREVSLEPATPQATTADVDAGNATEGKEHRAPAKKNRLSGGPLEATQEEAEEEEATALNGSPPHETKIRQISQGVEDITWQNMKKDTPSQSELKMEEDESATPTEPATTVKDVAVPAPEGQQDETVEDASKDTPQEDVQVPPLLRGVNPPILDDTAGDFEDNGAAAGAEQPAGSHVSEAPQPSLDTASSSGSLPSTSQTQSTQTPHLPPHRRDSDSDQEKGLKRKLGDRTVSERLLPGEQGPSRGGTPPVGATKRPRDDPEADPNTREKKRPTPPPEEDEKKGPNATPVAPPPASKFGGGFMAYASTSSPFASVNGPKVFGSKPSSSSPWAAAAAKSPSPFASSSTSPFATAAKDTDSAPSTSTSTSPQKRTGFEAFASATSPFASAAKRPKSPPPPASSSSVLGRSRSPSRHGTPARTTNAFTAYASGGVYGFAAASTKHRSGSTTPALGESSGAGVFGGGSAEGSALDAGKDDDSEKDSGVSFGERLREAKDKNSDEASDEEKKLNLTEQEVHTGEEDEDTVYQVRGKLFTLSPQNQWKEKGTGTLRLNVRREDGGGARLIMRKEAVYTVLLNATLFKGMKCFLAQDPRYIRFSVIEAAATTHYNLRVSNAKIAEELLEEINAHIPSE
ncbi:hypothetical protein C8Q77DRAFT_1134385 [Trametes polyzona]|nr:hypothetical protein C8Q77DRAFT_1134385 [Trametes polyzona]